MAHFSKVPSHKSKLFWKSDHPPSSSAQILCYSYLGQCAGSGLRILPSGQVQGPGSRILPSGPLQGPGHGSYFLGQGRTRVTALTFWPVQDPGHGSCLLASACRIWVTALIFWARAGPGSQLLPSGPVKDPGHGSLLRITTTHPCTPVGLATP